VRILAGRLSVATTLAAMIPIKMGGIRTILRCHGLERKRLLRWGVDICSELLKVLHSSGRCLVAKVWRSQLVSEVRPVVSDVTG
jgi:hypothetical protein